MKIDPSPIVKYIHFRGQVIEVEYDPIDGLWVDKDGSVYSFVEEGSMTDPVERCGVGPFSLPMWMKAANRACAAHDTAYSSPAYQAFHTRKEADEALEASLKIAGYPILGKLFKWTARLLGGAYWENKKTR